MVTPLLAKTLVRNNHVRSFHIRQACPTGWEASELQDQRVVQRQRQTDWHRVEQTLTRYAREIAALREQGWQEA
jgi:hypothetical protein